MPDFRFHNCGSIVLLTPLTPVADEWVDENLPDDRMTFGASIVIEPRYVDPIVKGLINDGLTIV